MPSLKIEQTTIFISEFLKVRFDLLIEKKEKIKQTIYDFMVQTTKEEIRWKFRKAKLIPLYMRNVVLLYR